MKKCLILVLAGSVFGGWLVQYDAGPNMILMVEEIYAQQRAMIEVEGYGEAHDWDSTLPHPWTQAPRAKVECRAEVFTLFPAREAERCAQQYEAIGYIRAEAVKLEELVAQRRALVAEAAEPEVAPVEPALAAVEKAVAAKVEQ